MVKEQPKNQSILVTGGTSGLGLELVHILLRRGYHVVATGRKPNTETLNLDKADVKIGSQNEIIINSYFAHEYYSMNLENSIFDRNQLS